MKKRIVTIIIILMLLSGLSLLLYPTVSNYILSLGYRRTIAEYRESLKNLDNEEYERLLAEAVVYNQWLAEKSSCLVDPGEEELEVYNSLLDPFGSGIMGYVVIPKINISLPIYHGVSDAVLQSGIGHLPGTSLPVGGETTHSIISGHRGLVSSRLFTDIDQLAVGDVFTLKILNETLTYEVDQIITILPVELSQQGFEEGQDYCTLLTCTPYGINTHRLLVRGHRIPTPEEEEEPGPLVAILEDGPGFMGLDAKTVLIAGGSGVAVILSAVVLLRWRQMKYRPKHLKRKGKRLK